MAQAKNYSYPGQSTEEEKLAQLAEQMGLNGQQGIPTQPVNLEEPEGAQIALGDIPPTNENVVPQPGSQPPQYPMEAKYEKLMAEREAAARPYLQRQEASQNDLMSEIAKLKSQKPGVNLNPLLAYSDANWGTKLQDSVPTPMTPQELQEKIIKLKQAAQGGQNAITSEQLKLLDSKLGSQMMLAGNKFSHQDLQMDERNAFRAHKDIVDTIKKDPMLKAQLGQLKNLDNAASIVANAKSLTPQQIDEFQQAVRSNLGIKGQSGVGEREKTLLNSLGLNAERWEQFLTGTPAEISKDDALVAHIRDLANVESSNVKNQINDRLQTVSGGFDSIYAKYPNYKKDLSNLVDQFSKQTRTNALGNDLAKQVTAQTSGVAMTNGKEVRMVPQEHIKDAEAEGYRRQ